MMSAAFYVMAILGCGEADTNCEQVSVVDSTYASLDNCNAATPAMVARNSDLLYPVVVAQCQRADRKLAQTLIPAQVDLPEPQAADRIKVRAANYAANGRF